MTKDPKTVQAKLKSAFPFVASSTPPPAPAPVAPQAPAPQAPAPAPAKPTRTVGNIYSAVQAQAIFNPGQATPPDPSQVPANSGAPGSIGNHPGNQTIKNAPAKQVDLGTSGSLQPEKGWGRTTDG